MDANSVNCTVVWEKTEIEQKQMFLFGVFGFSPLVCVKRRALQSCDTDGRIL